MAEFTNDIENEAGQGAETHNFPTSEYKVLGNMQNSTALIEYTYMPGQPSGVSLYAQLQGPTEAKFATKQDPSRTYIEVNLKSSVVASNQASTLNPRLQRDTKKLKHDIKSVLEQLVQTTAYPKTVLTFNLTFVQNNNNQTINLFGACINACIVLLNQAGINQKQAPFAAFTLCLKETDNLSIEAGVVKD